MTVELTKNPDGRLGQITTVDESKKTILIYSPDLNFCFSLSLLFQNKFNVITTTNPSTLEPFVTHYSPSLLLVDSSPSEKVRDQLHALKELNHELPIIMIYVYNSKESLLDRDVRKEVDSVFYKPFDLSVVSNRIHELLST